VYAEWARSAQPKSLRDLFQDPSHSQGYTVGLQWVGEPSLRGGASLRVQGELTNLEVGGSSTRRNVESFYLSRAVPQGYTHRGQIIGAAIGPGASSQWAALDWLAPRFEAGVFLQRIRWENDAYFRFIPPIAEDANNAWCQHDVTISPGVRGALDTRLGRWTLSATGGRRYNTFFVHALYCPSSEGRHESARSLSLGFSARVPGSGS
jgi:hypothetical protein